METTLCLVTEKERELATLREKLEALRPADEGSEQAAMLFVSTCRENEKVLDADRKAQTDPLNAQIKAISEPYKKVIEAFAEMRKGMEWQLDDYRRRKQLAQQAEQRRLIDEANKKKADEEKKADEARLAAVAARASGDERGAVKLEAKAVKAELKASLTVVEVVENTVQKTVALENGAKVTFKETKDWVLPGLDKTQAFYRDDVRLKGIADEYFVLDAMKVGKIIRAGGKVAGVEIVPKTTTSTRSR